MSSEQAVVVLVTAGSEANARAIARALVEERLAACVNLVPGITSIYRWRGAVEEAGEWLLVVKSRKSRVAEIENRVRELHEYDVPEVIAFEIAAGSSAYLDWLRSESS